MTPENHIEAANDLLNAEEKGEQIRLLTQRYPEMGMDDAYGCKMQFTLLSFSKVALWWAGKLGSHLRRCNML